ncbi:carboxymuconolactone decarboxylase family protein [Lunatibacter salilacus]|uniref:carboxymuconolactone decarboxylase family protein n=1 Tax=Lunatibacter salilacus TaxID=2483804 RepID=UPI00131B40B9|nr:carboxymuconolactone decarboxylase family protein [Lunatibacter salilacus]
MKNSFALIEHQDASPEVKEIYDDTMKTLGIPFVLNWFKCQAGNPSLLRGNWAKLKATLCEGDVPNIIKQLIIFTVSSERKCNYCAEAHKLFADMMGKSLAEDPAFLITENMDSEWVPNSYKVAVRTVANAALSDGHVEASDFESLKAAGYSEGDIQELFAQADLVNMLNTIANISGIQIDNEIVELSYSL